MVEAHQRGTGRIAIVGSVPARPLRYGDPETGRRCGNESKGRPMFTQQTNS